MQNLRQLSGSELAQLLHCVDQLHGMRWAMPTELWIKLDTYRADLLAELEERPLPRRQPGEHGGNGRCGCLCAEVHQAPGTTTEAEFLGAARR
jgi:hypothetical protein